MTEYSFQVARRFIEAADALVDGGDEDAGRAVLYLSLLSVELSLKSALESAGYSPTTIRQQSHNLSGLLRMFSNCEISENSTTVRRATSIRSIVANLDFPETTVGQLIDSDETSKYPNEVRYGELLRHFPPLVMLDCAKAVADWVDQNVSALKKR